MKPASQFEASRVAFVTSEMAPWSKAGGLGDVAAALPEALAQLGHDLRVFVPLYDTLASAQLKLQAVEAAQQVPLQVGEYFFTFNLFERVADPKRLKGLTHYFVQCAPVFERGGQVYTSHADEHIRHVVLMRAALESCQRLQWAPDIVHANDWTTALLPLYLRTLYAWDKLFESTRTVLTIHNLGYQGVFGPEVIGEIGLEGSEWRLDQADLQAGQVNFLKSGLMWADKITTVSPNYAQEIQTPQHGHGLDALLRDRSDDLSGILNGVDQEAWNPQKDPLIPFRYSSRTLWRKKRNKSSLIERFGLTPSPDAPLVGCVTRLASQKGLDLVVEALPTWLDETDLNLVVLGSGETAIETALTQWAEKWPSRIGFQSGFDEPLAHLIEAGSDLFLMPSLYEPCGLNQMYSQLYGTLPLVRRTGGLADTVVDITEHGSAGTGFVFDEANVESLVSAVDRALDLWAQPEHWRRAVIHSMEQDWSWERRAEEYAMVYRSLQTGL